MIVITLVAQWCNVYNEFCVSSTGVKFLCMFFLRVLRKEFGEHPLMYFGFSSSLGFQHRVKIIHTPTLIITSVVLKVAKCLLTCQGLLTSS